MKLLEKFKAVTTFVFDVDGVLTDGTLTVLPRGVMARKMNVKDGYALQLAVKRGYEIVVISGGASEEVADRLHKLGVSEVFMRVTDKADVLKNYLQKKGLRWDEVLFMGDDIPDLVVMKKVGFACCPADAVQEIKEISAYISPLNGGFGCGRDVIEKVLKMRGNWNEDAHIPSA
ncbi:KdsC family phosphatase [Segetibacter aerophilus]|uniref:3-deoxy-D-manno-octulosonate 8-phosphate phosphatase n=1 Tax=Segetibacter aerophilus TaxID=670293 RepID=A0A512B8Z9_9BACT|nr:HAD hydrolase family protein [Segetibacter aerophilus]GEO08430.1 3-deoxy-D-manno-octulosonate 8-phosphate phosphatase [Segetibacter aerophilus]